MTRRFLRPRLVLVALAPLVAVVPLVAIAATPPAAKSMVFVRSYSPAATGYFSLSGTVGAKGGQKSTVSITMRTTWVDTRAVADSPNILQQGLYVDPVQTKLQIKHGPKPSDHRAQCRVEGKAGGWVMATGPAIDVADGRWHTITCVKKADGANRTAVVVTVDGVAGVTAHSDKRIGNTVSTKLIDVGGRGKTINSDSLLGQIKALSFWLGG